MPAVSCRLIFLASLFSSLGKVLKHVFDNGQNAVFSCVKTKIQTTNNVNNINNNIYCDRYVGCAIRRNPTFAR